MFSRLKKGVFLPIILILSPLGAAAPVSISVDADAKGVPVQPTMYGIFFEDINFGADGGLYAEMVKNRAFNFPQPLMGWKTFGAVQLNNEGSPFAENPRYVRMTGIKHSRKRSLLENEGFRGMGFEQGKTYNLSVWARQPENEKPQNILVNLVDNENNVIGKANLRTDSTEWKRYSVSIKAGQTCEKGSLRLILESFGQVDLAHISLFPGDTWKNRKNGLRRDLVQALTDLKPGVFRFPGGCIVEGSELPFRYDWKKTVGPVENRPLNENLWNFSTSGRRTPDYYQTGGLGFYEYFLLAEDMGAEPLPIVNCGLACQFQTKEDGQQPMDQLGNYIQDALDLIEFANGSPETKWGKVRAEMGHPAPFNLKYIGVGNEQWGACYLERFSEFSKAIRARHPEIQIVGSSGPSPDGKRFDELWKAMREMKAELVDEHYYSNPKWFLENAARYDSYPRDGVSVFAGEYACYVKGFSNSPNNFLSALCEAAFMTGFERNADIVHMTTYAPLLAHKEAWQWRPDLIWFDNLSLVKTPNYYVQQLFSNNVGDRTVPVTSEGKPLTGQHDLYASGTYDGANKRLIIKLINSGREARDINLEFKGIKSGQLAEKAQYLLLHASNPQTENTFEAPFSVVPVSGQITIKGDQCSFRIDAETVGVYIFQLP